MAVAAKVGQDLFRAAEWRFGVDHPLGLAHRRVIAGLIPKAQLALGRYDHLELRSNGGIEAGAGCRSVLESDEMEPSQVIVEVFGCHAAPGAQEGFDPLM